MPTLNLQDKGLPSKLRQVTGGKWGGFHLIVNSEDYSVHYYPHFNLNETNLQTVLPGKIALGFYVAPSEDYGYSFSIIKDSYYRQLMSSPSGVKLIDKIRHHLSNAAILSYENPTAPYSPLTAIQSNGHNLSVNQSNEDKSVAVKNSHASIQQGFQALSMGKPPGNPSFTEIKLTPEEEFLSKASSYTRTYIDSFRGKTSHSDIVKEMNLTEAELNLLQGCMDSIVSLDIMDIPVTLNEQVYDFKTVLNFKGIDPSRNVFEPSHLQPCRKAVADFEKGIQQIKKMRMENMPEAPGGPGFNSVKNHCEVSSEYRSQGFSSFLPKYK